MVHAQSVPWNDEAGLLSSDEQARFDAMCARPAKTGFLHIIQDFPTAWHRHPSAKKTVVRTMFEVDRLPPGWAQSCNLVDRIWVPTDFGRTISINSGVDPDKIAVIPGCFDPAPYLAPAVDTPLTADLRESGKRILLSVFDWRLAKGWQDLLRGFYFAFGGRSGALAEFREDVTLVLKVWSTNFYSAEQIRSQAAEYVRAECAEDLLADDRVRFITEKLSRTDLLPLYKAADAFVLPTFGEGFGRPIAESMFCSVPVVVTNCSAQATFVTSETGFPINCAITPVSEAGWREVPTYKGACWAQPDMAHFVSLLRHVVDHPELTQPVAERGREEVCARFSREVVGKLIRTDIENLMR
jgi:glycosyltransferase involved in cell wall biosynthesis